MSVIVANAVRHRDEPCKWHCRLPVHAGGGTVVRIEHAGDAQQPGRLYPGRIAGEHDVGAELLTAAAQVRHPSHQLGTHCPDPRASPPPLSGVRQAEGVQQRVGDVFVAGDDLHRAIAIRESPDQVPVKVDVPRMHDVDEHA